MNRLDSIVFWVSIICMLILGSYFGIDGTGGYCPLWLFHLLLLSYAGTIGVISFLKMSASLGSGTFIFKALLLLISALLFLHTFGQLFGIWSILYKGFFFGLLLFQLAVGLSGQLAHSIRSRLHPALVFVLSFFLLILAGSFLLMLPGATHKDISYLQALFTSASAVSVTGLAVLDTGKDFTLFGQVIILLLIQLGGLGILTFSNLFAMLFSGGVTFRDQIVMSDFVNSENISNTQRTLLKIVIFVFATEALGAILIFAVTDTVSLGHDRFFFAIFHSISAFCNAGFSTLSNSLYESNVRFNYSLQTIVAFLFIMGGLGYNIVINYFSHFRYILFKRFPFLNRNNKQSGRSLQNIKINTIIVVQTTLFLIIGGWLAFFFLEYNNTLREHTSIWGKLAVSFFGAVTPRTAGFNSIDTGSLLLPTIIIYILLMWVGASPGSTGGGIKTTTWAIALLNIKNYLLGKQRLEFRHKEIPASATQRTTVIISLSLMAIILGIFFISLFNPGLDILKVAFECFSAFSTVGLSMGITNQFNTGGQLVLIILMFLGRVSLLTFLMAIVRQFSKPQQQRYQYPTEDIFIN